MPTYPEVITPTSGHTRVQDGNDRAYTIIGWCHLRTGDVQAILIPDYLSADEPLKFTSNGHLRPEGH